MAFLTPGIRFLFWFCVLTVLPPILFLNAVLQLSHTRDALSPGAYCACLALAYVCAHYFEAFRVWAMEELEMRAAGAVRVPEVRGRWPGNIDLLLARLRRRRGDGYPFEVLDGLTHKYGKIFNTKILGMNRIVTVDPNHMKIMLATEFHQWEKSRSFRQQNESVLGSGVFNVDGDMWKFHRTLTRDALSLAVRPSPFDHDTIGGIDTIGGHADTAITALRLRRGEPVDFQDVMFRFTLDAATEIFLGSCVHSLRALAPGTLPQSAVLADGFARALANVQHRLAQRSRMAPLWPLAEIFGDKTKKDMAVIRSFIEPIVKEALLRKKVSEDASEEAGRATLIDQLTDATQDPQIIADETLNILIAGRDTTAGTLSFLVYFLAMHPQVLKRLRAEILAEVGPKRLPYAYNLREMKYLRAVINETLRLFPPVPGNVRSPVKATTLPPLEPGGRPFYIPAGSKVPYAVMHMQRRKDVWGPDADIFDPERFLDERRMKYRLDNPFIFIPFNAGPRICLGQTFALNEMSVFVIRLLQTFDRIELAPDAQPPESLPPAAWAASGGRKAGERIRPRADLSMSIEGGLWVRLGEAGLDDDV